MKFRSCDLQAALTKVNEYRQKHEISKGLEDELEASYRCSHHLIVYGTLAPGRANHHIVEQIVGIWRDNVYVEGEFVTKGWAVEFGYPMIRWKEGGSHVPSHLLISEMLPFYWADLDHFEGPEYCRILVPVFDEHGFVAVGNLYAEKLSEANSAR